MDSGVPATMAASASTATSLPLSAPAIASCSSSTSSTQPLTLTSQAGSDDQPAERTQQPLSAPSTGGSAAATGSSTRDASFGREGEEGTGELGQAGLPATDATTPPPDEYPSFSGGFVPPPEGERQPLTNFALPEGRSRAVAQQSETAAVSSTSTPLQTSQAAQSQVDPVTSQLSSASTSDAPESSSTAAEASGSSSPPRVPAPPPSQPQRRRSSSTERSARNRVSSGSSSSSSAAAGPAIATVASLATADAGPSGSFTPLGQSQMGSSSAASMTSSWDASRLSVRKSKTAEAWDSASRPASLALIPVKVRDFAFPETDPRHVGARDVSQPGGGQDGRYHLQEESGEVEEEYEDDEADVGVGLGRWRRPAAGGASGDDWGPSAGYDEDDDDVEFEGDQGQRGASLEQERQGSGGFVASSSTASGGVPMSVDSLTPGTYRVLYDFEAEEEHELSCAVGDQVEVVGSIEGGWAVGRKREESISGTGREGLVPEGYLEWVGTSG